MKQTVVLFPGMGMGHLTPMVELAKYLTSHNFSVTVVMMDSPFDPSSAIAPFISRVSSTYPLISFHRLPQTPLPSRPNSKPLLSAFDLCRLSTPPLSDFLKSFSQTAEIRALVLDFLCTDALDVAVEMGIPSYFLFATSASNLATFLFLPWLQSQTTDSFKDLGDSPIHIPGVPPIPASHMMDQLQDRGDEVYQALMHHLERLPKADGIIINTFEALEPRAVQALVEGICVRNCTMPPIYCIGPLTTQGSGGDREKDECLKWLDEQPKGSVVFLCFGSLGFLSAEQVKEIAVGLERSGHRFLWVVRSPPGDETKKRFESRPETDLGTLLPDWFLERTKERGMVVNSWAPQAAVLAHESTGGFVSHCGWNSVLEAASAGVPIIAWPLYAEQRMNLVFLTEEAKLAVEMKGYDKELVNAEEVETKVRWLMESEGGRELKERAAKVRESAIAARQEGGPSDKAWMELVGEIKGDPLQ